MKKTLLFLGTIAVSAVTSGVTVWAVDRSHTDKIEYIEREVERTPALGSHFTAYEADKYPDLTYAAENAVKAVNLDRSLMDREDTVEILIFIIRDL